MQQKFLIITPPYLEKLCLSELHHKIELLALTNLEEYKLGHGYIELSYDQQSLIQVIPYIKTATRVLMRWQEFKARDLPKLFNKCKNLAWREVLFEAEIKYHVSCKQSRLMNTSKIEQTFIDATLAYHKAQPPKKNQPKPQNNLNHIFVRVQDDLFTISVDLIGYRMDQRFETLETNFRAPLRRSLASAILWFTRQTLEGHDVAIHDPFCGSGTIVNESINFFNPIEREMNFHYIKSIIASRHIDRIESSPLFKQANGSDLSEGIINQLPAINFAQADFFKDELYLKGKFVICNPPYQKRIQSKEVSMAKLIINRAQQLGAIGCGILLPKIQFPNTQALTSLKINNGGIDCRYRIYLF